MSDLPRLRNTLGSPQLSWVVDKIRDRIERGQSVEQGRIGLRNPTPAQREAIARLFGIPIPCGTTLSVSLPNLANLLQEAELCNNLTEAVEALAGPVLNLKSVKQAQQQGWTLLFQEATYRADSRASVRQWLEEIKASGLLRRLTGQDITAARQLLDQALRLIDRLPAQGMSLAELAADVTGDSHALDPGRPLGTIALRLAAILKERAEENGERDRRDLWAGVGVLCDELSAPVLTLNLRALGGIATAQALRLHAESGEPYRLSTRQLLRQPLEFSYDTTGPRVFVCENPTVVAAAANRLGVSSAPLVCIEGQPKTAARLLLDRLKAKGIDLLYHGDFDWDGVRIGNLVMKRHGARPWQFTSDTYSKLIGGTTLKGRPVSADWDDRLMLTMQRRGQAIHEEQALEALLEDLCSHKASPRATI